MGGRQWGFLGHSRCVLGVDPTVPPPLRLAIVGGCMGAWGAGKWSDPSSKVAKESFAALCTPDIVIDATAPMANTDLYKVRVRRARRDRPRPEMCEAAGGGQPPKRDAA